MRTIVILRVLLLGLGLVGGGAACDDDAGNEQAEAEDAECGACGLQVNCAEDAWAVGDEVVVSGAAGLFSLTIVSFDDWDDDVYNNAWLAQVTDAAGEVVTSATVLVDTYSVDCGHGGPAAAASVTANAEGLYELAPAFAHGGPWELRLEVHVEDAHDELHAQFCLEGQGHEMCEDHAEGGHNHAAGSTTEDGGDSGEHDGETGGSEHGVGTGGELGQEGHEHTTGGEDHEGHESTGGTADEG